MDHTVTTTGRGVASGVPDAMRFEVTVQARAASVGEALAAAADGVGRLGQVAREHTSEDRITSDGLRIHDDHDRDGRRVGVAAEHRLRVLCDLDAAGALVTTLGDGVGDLLRVDGVTPVLTDPSALEHEARGRAFEDALAKAGQLAALAGRALGRVLEIAEGDGSPAPGPRFAQVALAAAPPMPFEPGSSEVSAAVTVRWELA